MVIERSFPGQIPFQQVGDMPGEVPVLLVGTVHPGPVDGTG